MTDYYKIHKEFKSKLPLYSEALEAQTKLNKEIKNLFKPDMVNNPPHYNHKGIECIQAIKAALTPAEFRGYVKGNIMKYVWREQYKNKDEDLKKAQWYMNELIKEIENVESGVTDTGSQKNIS